MNTAVPAFSCRDARVIPISPAAASLNWPCHLTLQHGALFRLLFVFELYCSALNQTKSYQCHSTGKQIFTFSYFFFFCCIVFIFWWNVSQGQACERLQFCSEQLSFDLLPSTRAVQCGKVRRRRRILGTFNIDHYFLVTVELSRIHSVFVRLLERDETTLCAALGAQHIYFD